ncbi:phosphoribosylanthranilate isomerase [Halarchaeum sp. P4]|uniref:phosphoribosylanthranilate isomerase n=1 Tax=Halarchaeum sp. P4 TaxID=3421639 RepID=UPI003EC089BB
MSATRVKVCGLTNRKDVDAAVEAGADALGFIVDVPVDTPREITPERAADLVASVPPFVSTVLVTMPETARDVEALLSQIEPDAVQIHNDLDAAAVERLADGTDVDLVKVVDADDAETAHAYDVVVDALLVDSTDASGAGGTGRTHDWTVTRGLAAELDSPVVLAGGLTPENVADAVRTVEPYAVDVASGVEATGGQKDHDAVRAFVRRATRAFEGADDETGVSA